MNQNIGIWADFSERYTISGFTRAASMLDAFDWIFGPGENPSRFDVSPS